MTTHFHIMPRLRMNGAVSPVPIHLHDVQSDNFTFTCNENDEPFFGARIVNFGMVIRV